MLAQFYCNQQMNYKGMKRDPSDINVFITERNLRVKCSNTWKQMGDPKNASLN